MESHYIHLNSEQKEFPTIPCSYVEMLKEKKGSDKIGYVCLTCEKHICD